VFADERVADSAFFAELGTHADLGRVWRFDSFAFTEAPYCMVGAADDTGTVLGLGLAMMILLGSRDHMDKHTYMI
jgi:hypothetical protein